MKPTLDDLRAQAEKAKEWRPTISGNSSTSYRETTVKWLAIVARLEDKLTAALSALKADAK